MTTPTKIKKTVPADILQVQNFLDGMHASLSDVMAMEVEEWSDKLLNVVADWKDDASEPDWQSLRNWLNRICADVGMPTLFPKTQEKNSGHKPELFPVVAENTAPDYAQSHQLSGYEAGKGNAHEYIPDWMDVPPLYANENNPDPIAVIKLFTPWSSWSWCVL